MMTIRTEIVTAIESMLVMEVLYKGSWRTVEPHLFGINQKDNLCLSAFQRDGGSGQSWRAFLINDIEQINLTDEIFQVREGYNPLDRTMKSIITAV